MYIFINFFGVKFEVIMDIFLMIFSVEDIIFGFFLFILFFFILDLIILVVWVLVGFLVDFLIRNWSDFIVEVEVGML